MKPDISLQGLNFAPHAMPLAANLLMRFGAANDFETQQAATDYLQDESHRFDLSFTQHEKGWTMRANLTCDKAVTGYGDCVGTVNCWDEDVVAAMTYMPCKQGEVLSRFRGRMNPVNRELCGHFSDAAQHISRMRDKHITPLVIHSHYLIASPEEASAMKNLPRRPELLRQRKIKIFTEDFLTWGEAQDEALEFAAVCDPVEDVYYILGVSAKGIYAATHAKDFGEAVLCVKALDEALILPAMQSTPEGRRALTLQENDLLNYKKWHDDVIVARSALTQIPYEARPGVN